MKRIDEIINNLGNESPERRRLLATGLKELDRMIGGLDSSDLIVVGARPAMGKTPFLLTMAMNIAAGEDVPVLFYSYEMTSSQLIKRMLSIRNSIDFVKLENALLTEKEWIDLLEKAQSISKLPIYIVDKPEHTIEQVVDTVKKAVESTGARIVFLDYLQLLTSSKNFQNRYEEMAYCTRELKHLARTLDIPIVISSQLNRNPEHRETVPPGPMMWDLRDSGTICEDSNVVMLLDRPEVRLKSSTDESGNNIHGALNVIVAKNHLGYTGDIRLHFDPATGVISDWDDSVW